MPVTRFYLSLGIPSKGELLFVAYGCQDDPKTINIQSDVRLVADDFAFHSKKAEMIESTNGTDPLR